MSPEAVQDFRIDSDHVNRLVQRVAEALTSPLVTDQDLASLQSLLDATALELNSPEDSLAQTMRNASNEIELIRFTVSTADRPSALNERLAQLRAAVEQPSGV